MSFLFLHDLEKAYYVLTTVKFTFIHLTVTEKSHQPPCFTVHAEISNLPTHLANVCQPQPDTIMQVTKKLYRWEYFVNTFNSQSIWWFCFPASGLWIKEYLWPIPQVQKVKKKMQLPTGLNLQPGRLVTLSAKRSQTWPFRAKSFWLWTTTTIPPNKTHTSKILQDFFNFFF